MPTFNFEDPEVRTRQFALYYFERLGYTPDPWQHEVLTGQQPRLLLNCCRQAGKSTVVAMLGLTEAICKPFSKVLILSRSHRQSRELFRIMRDFYVRVGSPMGVRVSEQALQLKNGSRIVSLPCREETIRGYSGVTLLLIDEAARVPDELYRAARPMLATSKGRLICLSTPFGKRGFFYDAWANGGDIWSRLEVNAAMVSRIPPEFLQEELKALGESWYRQEYCCSFESVHGLVYPEMSRCVVKEMPAWLGEELARVKSGGRPRLPHVGGIDFGFRNPFAAVWGVLDAEDILWLVGERYARKKPQVRSARLGQPDARRPA